MKLLFNYLNLLSMTSFQLVNHQIRHIFGGIEAQKNASLDHLQNQQKKISKTMEKAQFAHKKIYQAMATIKNSLLELAQNYLGLAKETKLSGGLINQLSSEINILLQDVSEQSLSLSKKMESKAESYIPNLKRMKEKYTQSAQNLEHYRRKVSLLKKSVSRQSLANIKQEDHERYQRNKQKLKKAQKEYNEILHKITKRFSEFNNQGIKDLYHDLITIFSTFGGDVMIMNRKITKYLSENITSRQILLAKQIKFNSNKLNKLDNQNKRQSITNKGKQQNAVENHFFFEHLAKQKQIANYIKNVIDRQLTKSNTAEKIQQLFNKAQNSKQTDNIKGNIQTFAELKNVFNNQQLQNHQKKITQTIKDEQDLLEIDQNTEISHELDNEQIINCDISCSPESDKKYSIDHDLENKMKNNLDKFNKICEENSMNKTHKVRPRQNNDKPIKFPQSRLDFGAPNSKNIQIINSSEFFNVNFFEQNQQQKKIKHNEPKSVMHSYPSISPNVQNHNKSDQKNQAPIINVISPPERKKSDLLFTNFDQFIGKHHQTQKTQKSIQNKSSSNSNDLFQFISFPNSSSNIQTKVSSKSDSSNYDLLNL